MFYWFIKWIAWPLRAWYFRIRVEGLEKFPREGPAILVANHASYLDAGVLGSVVPRKVHFVVLSEMFAMWRIRWFYVGMETIPVQPGRPDHTAIRRALKILRQGGVIGIFPEGSRSEDGALQPPLPGAAMIAERSGAPVIPAAILGAWEAFPRGRLWPRPRRIRVRFGDPFRIPRIPRGERDSLAAQGERMMREIGRLRGGGESPAVQESVR